MSCDNNRLKAAAYVREATKRRTLAVRAEWEAACHGTDEEWRAAIVDVTEAKAEVARAWKAERDLWRDLMAAAELKEVTP